MAINDLSYITESVTRSAGEIAAALTSPHVLMRPAVYPDGNMWCALYGENLQDGVCGFGETPAAAMADFDKNWHGQTLSSPTRPIEG